jgi:4-amino-4-deoxy-L-arabinose transferase-like glycosyltransferase
VPELRDHRSAADALNGAKVLAVIRVWARTLPERFGGRLVFAALLAVLVVALVVRVVAAVNGYDFRHGSDADQYERLAAGIFHGDGFGIPGSENPFDFAPGAPYFAAAIYWLVGDVDPTAARIGMAIAGTVAVFLIFLIGHRLGGPIAGLIGAALAAAYPAPIFYTGLLSSEPIAMLTVAGAVLAFMWAVDGTRGWWAWLVPGALFGLTAYLRPEYLLLTGLFALLALALVWRRRGIARGVLAAGALVAAFAVVLAPWTAYVSNEVGRFVPVSTGGGKALFIGTYLPGDGLHDGVKRALLHRTKGNEVITDERLRRIPMNPLLDRVASRYPELSRDDALGRVGRENLSKYVRHEPVDFGSMMAGKIAHMWHGAGDPSYTVAGSAYHYIVLVLGLCGFVLLVVRRRWETLPIGLLVVGMSLIGGLLLAGVRRNMTVMPFVLALAGVAIAAAVTWFLARRSGKEPLHGGTTAHSIRQQADPVPQRGVRQGEGTGDGAAGAHQDGGGSRQLQEAPAGSSEGDQGAGQGSRAPHQEAGRQGRVGQPPGS